MLYFQRDSASKPHHVLTSAASHDLGDVGGQHIQHRARQVAADIQKQ